MGNDATKQIAPDYTNDDSWICGPNEMDYVFPDPKDAEDNYLKSKLEEKTLVEDPEFNKDKLMSDTKNILENIWDSQKDKNNRNKLFVFYVHNLSPLLIETDNGKNKKNKSIENAMKDSDDINFDACIHASLFRLIDGDCTVYSPKFRMQIDEKKGKNKGNSYEFQTQDIRNAFRQFIAMIHSQNGLCPYIVAAQGASSGIVYNELIKLKDEKMQSLLVAALLPGYPISSNAKNSWFGTKLHHWRTFKIDNSNSYIFENMLESDEKQENDNFEMINPVIFSNELSARAEQNIASLVRDLDSKKCYFQYQVAKCDISVNKSNMKGILLTGNDNRLKDSFNTVDTEYLVYWLAIRSHIKGLCQAFYKTTLPVLQEKERKLKEANQKPENYDDL